MVPNRHVDGASSCQKWVLAPSLVGQYLASGIVGMREVSKKGTMLDSCIVGSLKNARGQQERREALQLYCRIIELGRIVVLHQILVEVEVRLSACGDTIPVQLSSKE
jgi:hypothetical protein